MLTDDMEKFGLTGHTNFPHLIEPEVQKIKMRVVAYFNLPLANIHFFLAIGVEAIDDFIFQFLKDTRRFALKF